MLQKNLIEYSEQSIGHLWGRRVWIDQYEFEYLTSRCSYPHIVIALIYLAWTIDHSGEEELTRTPASDSKYVNRLPNCMANGCQKSKPQPANRNKYPVPSFNVLTGRPVASERGVITEYTFAVEIPAKRVYLRINCYQ